MRVPSVETVRIECFITVSEKWFETVEVVLWLVSEMPVSQSLEIEMSCWQLY